MPKFHKFHTRSAVLTAEQVLEIRQRYSQGETQGSLCREFGVSVGTIGRIVRGETWKQFSGPRAEAAPDMTPVSQSEIDQSLARVLHNTEVTPEREAALLDKLNRQAGKDPAIQADRALDQLLSDKAKKFLE